MLHKSVENRQWNIAEILMMKGADLNVRDIKGQTPLMIELDRREYSANISFVEQLMPRVNVNIPNNDMESLLHVALRQGNDEVADYLLRHGADVTAENRDGLSPLELFYSLCPPHPKPANHSERRSVGRRRRHRNKIERHIIVDVDINNILYNGCMALFYREGIEDNHFLASLKNLLLFCKPLRLSSVEFKFDYNGAVGSCSIYFDNCYQECIPRELPAKIIIKLIYLVSCMLRETGCVIATIPSKIVRILPENCSEVDLYLAEETDKVWDEYSNDSVQTLQKICSFSVRRNMGVFKRDCYAKLDLPLELQKAVSFESVAEDLLAKWKMAVGNSN